MSSFPTLYGSPTEDDVENDEAAIEGKVPAAAIRWLLFHHTRSNIDLAILSNVCREWRQLVSWELLNIEHENGDGGHQQRRHGILATSFPYSIRNLLLPSMIRELRMQVSSQLENEDLRESNWMASSQDTYCIAWFHPDGLECMQLTRDVAEDDEMNPHEDSSVYCVSPIPKYAGDHRMESDDSFHPLREMFCARSEDDLLNRRNGQTKASPQLPTLESTNQRRNQGVNGNNEISGSIQNHTSEPKDLVTCMYQWNGYSQAVDVLEPFGYAASFVRCILDEALHPSRIGSSLFNKRDNSDTAEVQYSRNTSCSSSSLSIGDQKEPVTKRYPLSRTVAVRGATFARPEGYCLCWEHLIHKSDFFSERSNDSKALVKEQEWDGIHRRRLQKQKELQREVLPIVVPSRRIRESERNCPGILQPSVQFLNVDSSHAVRLFTPPFSQPIPTPITVFCVAIATEDGCFFSGQRNKFEIGHLYPSTPDEILAERSPICICADYKGPSTRLVKSLSDHQQLNEINDDGTFENYRSTPMMAPRRQRSSGYYNSDDSSCDMNYIEAAAGNPGWKCHCPLSGLGDIGNDIFDGSSQESDRVLKEPGQVCRGQLGPGTWHCYVAVVDGQKSRIRIDGMEERLVYDSSIPSTFQATLDGLTIGSDHTFDMSLCFGQGSEGEGEGALAELALFKGNLDDHDICGLEKHLMQKHGINRSEHSHEDVAVADVYMRMARSLLLKFCDSDLNASITGKTKPQVVCPVPLKYLAKLKEVAWKQFNPVTGEPIIAQRIGSKSGLESSSDW